ncbi:FtsX-like permease family protein [Tunicatimonas pelagia]|uniref:FtsX-like permease family protein n=1 Tax=Tunicatimonas pelagia TaxID=931531 RepID=UPI0026652C8E|nr:FtsX-like permease family protein [Tunicatimonas pelagia]WKN44015.1 ABC transporter permease [Tunicatimonas pelagia]
MIRNFFITAFRNLKRDKVYTAINVAGLTLGIACGITIFVLVRFETSFDDFHTKADRIYRVNLLQKSASGRRTNGYNFYPLGEVIRSEVSGLEAVTSMHHNYSFQFAMGENIYEGEHAFFVDSAYFSVFDGEWLLGNPRTAFREPNTVVVTDQFAKKYLGGVEPAMDSTFVFDQTLTLKVNGVLKTPPHNTDMPYSMLISYPSLPAYVPRSTDNWKWVGWGTTFIALQESTGPRQIRSQLHKVKQKYLTEDDAKRTSFVLMPLKNNHHRNGNYNSFTYDFPLPLLIILSVVAGMIAFIACINFINLATAQSLNRAREVGIRKTLGSSRIQLIVQYASEALVITLIAVALGLALARVPMQIINARAGYTYLNYDFFQSPSMVLFLTSIILLITLLAGFYPAFVLSGFKPVKALQGKISSGKPKGLNLRRVLVITQFVGAQVLILVTAIVIYQINHLRERPIGFDTEAIVFTVLPDTTQDITTFKQQLSRNPNIQDITFGWGGPLLNAGRIQFYGEEGETYKQPGVIHYGDEQYISMFERTLLAGTNFSADRANPINEVIVNQAMIKALEIANPDEAIGEIFTLGESEITIRGVINDTYTNAFSSKIDPLVLQYDPSRFSGVAIKIAPDQVAETLQFIETTWKETYPDHLIDIRFLDETLDKQYSFFDMVLSVLQPAAFLAILIGCMGLYGLISFMTVRRTKEVGIRKVLGATVTNIIFMFTRESLLLVAIAFILAAPAGYFLGQAFLMELPERIPPGVELFVATLLVSLTIALLTIYYRSSRAAATNPADSLRYE